MSNELLNNAQNALKVAIFRQEIEKFSGDGDIPSPNPTLLGAFGASILEPSALDLGPPPLQILDPPLQERRTTCTSLCQISSKSLQPRPIYGDFSFVSRWRPPHLRFTKFQIFNVHNGPEDQTASPCQILSKSLQPLPRLRFFDFSRWRPPPSWIFQI